LRAGKTKRCLLILFLASASAQLAFSQSAMFGANFSLLSAGGATYGYEIVGAGIQGGIALPISRQADIYVLADTGFGLNAWGAVPGILSGHLGGLLEARAGNFLIGFGAGVSNKAFGLFPLTLFIAMLGDEEGSFWQANGEGEREPAPFIPYLRISFSIGQGADDGFSGLTAFFEHHFGHGFRTGLTFTARITWERENW